MESFHSPGNSYLFQMELISLWISERIVLPPALICSVGIWSRPDYLCLFSSSVFMLASKVVGSGASGSAIFISVCWT
jgi:hypothetical protein